MKAEKLDTVVSESGQCERCAGFYGQAITHLVHSDLVYFYVCDHCAAEAAADKYTHGKHRLWVTPIETLAAV